MGAIGSIYTITLITAPSNPTSIMENHHILQSGMSRHQTTIFSSSDTKAMRIARDYFRSLEYIYIYVQKEDENKILLWDNHIMQEITDQQTLDFFRLLR